MKQRDLKDQRDPRDPAYRNDHASGSSQGFIPPHGGYEDLHSFQKARIVFDATVYFCARFLEKRDRTEGSQVSGTSKELELKLTNVARASLEELREDYRDFLRKRQLEEWTIDHPFTRQLRQLNRTPGANYDTFGKGIEHPEPAICTNVILGLVQVTNYLLDRQILTLERAFIRNGGMREAMARARLQERRRSEHRGSY